MKRREFLKLSATLAGATMTAYLPAGWTPARAAAKWKVGFSQCTTLEPWRVQFNKDIEAEAEESPGGRTHHHRRAGQDRKAGRRRRESYRSAGRRVC